MTTTVASLAPAHAVIEVTHTGSIAASDMRGAAKQAQALGAGMEVWHILSDFSGATSVPGGIEMLNLMEALQKAGVSAEFRQAFVWPADASARLGLDVLKMAEQNRGLNARAFNDREAALEWLDS